MNVDPNIRCITWNARSVSNKKTEIETLAYQFNLDIISITESWLNNNKNDWHLRGYRTFRYDRQGPGMGGGVLTLVKKSHIVERLQLKGSWIGIMDAVGFKIKTEQGPIFVITVYIPPNIKVTLEHWIELLEGIPSDEKLLIMGDLNAHTPIYSPYGINHSGRALLGIIEINNLILLNDAQPTFGDQLGGTGSVLDLVMGTSQLSIISESWTLSDTHGSDHFPVFLMINVRAIKSCEGSNRLRLNKVDWVLFKEKTVQSIKEEKQTSHLSVIGRYQSFIDSAIDNLKRAGAYIPKNKSEESPVKPLWWTVACEESLQKKKCARKIYLRDPSEKNLENYLELEKEASKIILESKKKSFMDLCNSINPAMGTKRIWGLIKAFQGKFRTPTNISNDPDADELIDLKEELIGREVEVIPTPKLPVINTALSYNLPFTEEEFNSALASCNKDSAPGLDQISYEALFNLPKEGKDHLRSILNELFQTSEFPDTWKESLVKFIPKPGGKGNRPISLTSNAGKLMERLVQRRLDHFLENKRLIPPHQFGFRRGRSVIDCVSVLAADAMNGFAKKKGTAILALDLKGAFNALLPAKVLEDLEACNVPERLYNFISHMITSRKLIFGKPGNDPHLCGTGVPQGGVLSPTLFNFALRKINYFLPEGIKVLQYADDILLYCRFNEIKEAVKLLEKAVADLRPWFLSYGLKLAPKKTQLCILERRRKNHAEVSIRIDEDIVWAASSMLYLGVMLDSRLTWRKHVDYIVGKSLVAVNIMRALARVSWGANPEVLLRVYKGLIRAHLEWGAVLFAGSTGSVLKALDKAQYQALRTALGCMRTTPIPVLLSEAGESPLKLRRARILKRYSVRIATWRDNPLAPRLKGLRERLKSNMTPAKFMLKFSLLETLEPVTDIVGLKTRCKRPGYYDYPWNELVIETNHIMDMESGYSIKKAGNPNRKLQEILVREYHSPTCIFTDGAHPGGESVGASSFYIPVNNTKQATKLYNCFSAVSAELHAISQALKYSLELNMDSVLICTDSQSALIKIRDRMRDFAQDPIIHEIARYITLIIKKNFKINFMWIPAHSGITGNEEADKLAKIGLTLNMGIYILPLKEDLDKVIHKDFEAHMKYDWPFFETNRTKQKYFEFIDMKTERPWFSGYEAPRSYINLITRLRTGHICTGHHFIKMGWNISPICKCGQGNSSLKHYLHDCEIFSQDRAKFYEFLMRKLGRSFHLLENLDFLIFFPNLEIIMEIGNFLIGKGVII